MKSLLYCQDPGKAGQNFIPAKRDHVITPLHRKLTIQICFCKVAKKKKTGKKFLPETFLSYQKGISAMDVFIILQLSRSVRLRRK